MPNKAEIAHARPVLADPAADSAYYALDDKRDAQAFASLPSNHAFPRRKVGGVARTSLFKSHALGGHQRFTSYIMRPSTRRNTVSSFSDTDRSGA